MLRYNEEKEQIELERKIEELKIFKEQEEAEHFMRKETNCFTL